MALIKVFFLQEKEEMLHTLLLAKSMQKKIRIRERREISVQF
jgi:hypothetical protein